MNSSNANPSRNTPHGTHETHYTDAELHQHLLPTGRLEDAVQCVIDAWTFIEDVRHTVTTSTMNRIQEIFDAARKARDERAGLGHSLERNDL